MIYLDNASTTRMAPEVLDAMIPYMTSEYGNPGASWYGLGRKAKENIEVARKQVSDFLGCQPEQVIFTSGGTEGNNMVLLGLAETLRRAGKTHVIVSSIEHDSVLKAAEALRKLGFHITKLPVNRGGKVNLATLKSEIRAETGLISIMYVNNELGSVNPVSEIGKMCRDWGIYFHCDCVQSAGTIPLSVERIGCDFLTISSHKIHGPKGVGAIFARDRGLLTPLVFGGATQEFALRGGTENVAGIVGFGVACKLAEERRTSDCCDIALAKRLFVDELLKSLSESGELGVGLNGYDPRDTSKVLSLYIQGVDASTLLLLLDSKGVCMSAGSACNGSSNEPSHVLLAIGLTETEARQSIRVSFSRYTTTEDVMLSARILAECIICLRKLSEL